MRTEKEMVEMVNNITSKLDFFIPAFERREKQINTDCDDNYFKGVCDTLLFILEDLNEDEYYKYRKKMNIIEFGRKQ